MKEICRGLGRKLLRVPFFYKLAVFNAAIIAVDIAASIALALLLLRFGAQFSVWLLALALVVIGLLISVSASMIATRFFLAPFDKIQAAVSEVQRGNLGVRLDGGPLADDQIDQFTATVNQMLATLEQRAQEMRWLSRELMQVQDDERRRIARELHDEAGQSMTALLMRLKLLENSHSLEEVRKSAQELRDLTAHTLEEMGRIALELRPPALDEMGLDAALCARVDELSAHRIEATLRIVGLDGRLPAPIESSFYRVTQEALTNIARHSQACRADITLQRSENWLSLEIVDDGVGFDVTELRDGQQRGLGISGMRERMALVGGQLFVESQPGSGTRLLARAPIANEEIYGSQEDHGADSG